MGAQTPLLVIGQAVVAALPAVIRFPCTALADRARVQETGNSLDRDMRRPLAAVDLPTDRHPRAKIGADRSVHVAEAAADLALMQRIATRDASALRTLHDRYAGLVYSLCYRILHDREAAADVLLEVFMEVWQKYDRFDAGRGSVIAYLATLTRSRALDRLRAERAIARREEAVFNAAAAEVAAGPAKLQASADDAPLEQALLAERRAQVREAMTVLPPDQRAAIELAYFEGLTHAEVAAKMARPLGTVKTWIRAGLIHLRESLRNLG